LGVPLGWLFLAKALFFAAYIWRCDCAKVYNKQTIRRWQNKEVIKYLAVFDSGWVLIHCGYEAYAVIDACCLRCSVLFGVFPAWRFKSAYEPADESDEDERWKKQQN
jgi:hypothetical protein